MPVFGVNELRGRFFMPKWAELGAHRGLRALTARVFSFPQGAFEPPRESDISAIDILRDLGPLGARRPCSCLVVNELRERVFHLERPIRKNTDGCVSSVLLF